MLKKKYFVLLVFLYTSCVLALNLEAVEIMALLKGKHYKTAARLLEKAVSEEKNKEKKGYYAFLLNQIPENVSMDQPRYEYAHMAAQWAPNVPKDKRILLWVEAGDGFFHKGFLKEGEHCYGKAIKLIKKHKDKNKLSYVQYKKAWIYVNQKNWEKAFDLLAESTKFSGKLKRNIFFDLGKVWSESQRFSNKIPLTSLEGIIKKASRKNKSAITNGVIQGIIRSMKDDISSVVSTLSQNKALSTHILSALFSSDKISAFPPCELLPWVEDVHIDKLKPKVVLPMLNSCVKLLTESTGKKKKKKIKNRNLKSLVKLYGSVERRGIKRWPMVLAYEHLGWKKSACGESVKQFYEVVKEMISTKDDDVTKSVAEAARLCKKQRPRSILVKAVVKEVLESKLLALKYKNMDGVFESNLFSLFNLRSFRKPVKNEVLKLWKSKWMKRDLFPNLVLSGIRSYSSKELRTFLYQWASLPVSGIYLDIMESAKKGLLSEKDLDNWLPLKRVNSYTTVVPWMRQALSKPLELEKQKVLVDKILTYFPSDLKAQKKTASFVSLHFLKTDQIDKVFANWEKLNTAFVNRHLAVELFEKSVYDADEYCSSVVDVQPLKKKSLLVSFIRQSCALLDSDNQSTHKMKIPKILSSSLLAQDLAVLRLTHNRTLRLKKGISSLEYKTAPMVLKLRQSIVNFHKRKWKLTTAQLRCQSLLQDQIMLFRAELNKLSKSSPHGDQYVKLAAILDEWRKNP